MIRGCLDVGRGMLWQCKDWSGAGSLYYQLMAGESWRRGSCESKGKSVVGFACDDLQLAAQAKEAWWTPSWHVVYLGRDQHLGLP